VRHFATRGSVFAAARGTAPPLSRAHDARMLKMAGFFRVSFARETRYATFESWKSSFEK
jgi:hypothetical protein